jgi:hypothetical protein
MGCGVVTISGASGLQALARLEGVDPGRANREAMPDLTAKRTLVKSPPELWSELSEVERLARHLGAFGEIKITKLEPEHTVAWEGEGASGTVSIEPSGWGTKVTLTAQLGEAEVAELADEVETGGGVGEIAEREVEEPAMTEAAAEEGVLAPPEAEDSQVEESAMTQAVAQEPEVEGSHAEEPEAEEPRAEELEVEEPQVEEPPPAMEPPAREPIGTKPRRKRGFFGWLFRQRTSAQLDAPPAPAPSEPEREAAVVEVDEAPVGGPVAQEPPGIEEAWVNAPVADELTIAEEPPIAEEPLVPDERPVANEPHVAEKSPLADDLPGDKAPAAVETVAEESAAVEQVAFADPAPAVDEPPILDDQPTGQDPRLDPERAQAILDGALDALGSAHHRPFSRG